jgi:hypothetical protein
MVDVARSCLNKLITGNEIWTGRFMTKRVTGADGELTKVIRLNAPHTSLGQAEKLGFAPDMGSQTANVAITAALEGLDLRDPLSWHLFSSLFLNPQ